MSKSYEFYSHRNEYKNETVLEHLTLVAKYAERFGNEFGQGKVCKQLGLLHDVGKHTEKFQDVLFHRNDVHGIDHAFEGFKLFVKNSKLNNFERAYLGAIIASHHSNLSLDLNSLDTGYLGEVSHVNDKKVKINAVSSKQEEDEIVEFIKDNNLLIDLKQEDLLDTKLMTNLEKMLYIRMLFSCLVDADYTATASFENNDYYRESETYVLETDKYIRELNKYREQFTENKDVGINVLRNYVYDCCTKTGDRANKEIYSLNAPTGTAKTLALINFALRCAKKNNQKRIFIVLPYLSITSQNAQIYKEIFGNDVVLEDDSSVEFNEKTKLYSERWSAPIIVTTSVKFFESMFKSRASECRRLHQITNSVIVFDECQTLDNKIVTSSMKSLQALTKYFNSTVLLSTATLPVYQYRKNMEDFDCKEIISDVNKLFDEYRKIKNTKVVADTVNHYSSKDLLNVRNFRTKKQILYIFNTVDKARDMYQLLLRRRKKKSVFLITSRMCNQHKLDVIEEVKRRLKNNEECYLVATQTVEVGVDIDFPCGMREFAPIDSLIQSAGRINRNGKKIGHMFIFLHEDDKSPYKEFSEISERMAKEKYNKNFDLNNLELINDCYKEIYTYDKADEKKELDNTINEQNGWIKKDWFLKVDENYYLIPKVPTAVIIVPYSRNKNDYRQLVERIRKQDMCISKKQMKECKTFTVNIQKTTNASKLILADCEQLFVKLQGNEKVSIEWYIANENMYDQSGLHEVVDLDLPEFKI